VNPAKLNAARGTCPCPVCQKIANAYTYRGRPNELQRRRAGKWYLRCPACGLLQGDGDGFQTHILENITWFEPSTDPAAAPAANSPGALKSKSPAPLQKTPAQTPAPPAVIPPAQTPAQRRPWGSVLDQE